MKYYIISKNNIGVGIGNTNNETIPKNDNWFKYKEISKIEYNNLLKKEYSK